MSDTKSGDDVTLTGFKEDSVEAGKNKYSLLCIHCPSKILNPQNGDYWKEDKELPKMSQKKNAPEVETDRIEDWFIVDDMFTFENVGVSYVVDNTKYLTCADCEIGPIGWMDVTNQKSYIALTRVRQSQST